uniref:Phosphatidylinositol-specific phospholipase C X domain-containing protein n=1 Tax=Sphaeramia orbicularis TaxID=375764 RepID=A0A673AM66_9TELE
PSSVQSGTSAVRHGSHDTMSYDLDINSAIIGPTILTKFGKIRWVRKIVKKWGTTQEVNVTEQLDAGVRFLDLRVAHKPDDPDPTRTYFYHGLYTVTDVESALRDINIWAENHSTEILILALSHFKGFNRTVHNHLISFIKGLFGQKLILKTDIPTLNRCWDLQRNVIVSYDADAEVRTHPELRGKIPYYYGDTMDPAKVKKQLSKDLKTAPSNKFFACGLNLTLPENASALKYILRWKSLFVVTLKNLPQLVMWVQRQAQITDLNIVASDFVTQANFISTIIQLNT